MSKRHVLPVLHLATLSAWHQESSSKMVAPFEACIREKQHSVIRFLGSEGVNPSEIHRRMKMQYGARMFVAAAGV